MAEVYGAVTDRILINLAHHFQYIKAGNAPSGSWDYQIRKLAEMGQVTKETEQIILQMLGGADSALQKLLEESIREALKDVEKPLRTAAEKGLLKGAGMIPPEVDPNQMQAFQAYYQQSADKLNLVNTVMLESTQAAYTATVADIANRMNAVQGILNTETGGVVTGVTTLNQAIRSGVQRMVQTGITGYIDHGGHHWSPEAYVAMDVRTTMANASREAVLERNEQYGNDLYQVSHHDGARPLCYPWQGKVISRDDLSREVEDDEGNKVHVYAQSETTYGQAAGLFGVNCKHYPIPFVPGFSRIRPPEQDKEANDKEYAESQQQRALERNYRYEKRDLAVLKAQGADEEEIKAQRERVKTARNNLDDFCEETGRARRTGREGTPIDAKWPIGGGEVRRFGGDYVRTDQPLPSVSRVRNPAQTPTQTTSSQVAQNATNKTQNGLQFKQATSEIATKTLPNSGIQAVDLTKWDHTPTEKEIIDAVGGGDKTSGSCASVGLAYAGNKAGYQVHDFRGGDSMDWFSRKSNTQKIAEIPGIDGTVIVSRNEIKTANKLLSTMEAGKEYWLGIGRHASIVRGDGSGGYEYLELQSETNNGWFTLNDRMLKYRFGCVQRRSVELPARLIEVDKLAKSPEFPEILRYINTEVSKQRKGGGGGIK